LTLANFLVYSGDDDDKQVEIKKHHGRRKQLDGGSSLIETPDTPMYGSIPLTHGRNFFGFTFMDFSGE
jgi:intein/homing endonuclease